MGDVPALTARAEMAGKQREKVNRRESVDFMQAANWHASSGRASYSLEAVKEVSFRV